MSSSRTIFRSANLGRPYTQISNKLVQDLSISSECRGVLVYLVSLPADWQFNMAWFCKTFNVGRDKAYRIIEEAIVGGYMIRTQARTDAGSFAPVEYYFGDEPAELQRFIADLNPEEPLSENQEPASDQPDNRFGVDRSPQKPEAGNQEPAPIQRKDSYKEKTLTKTPAASRKRQGDLLDRPEPDEREEEIRRQRREEEEAFLAFSKLAERHDLKNPPTRLTARKRSLFRQIMAMEGSWPALEGGRRVGALGLEGFMVALQRIEQSPYLLGKTEEGFELRLGCLLNEEWLVETIEGKYAPRSAKVKPCEAGGYRKPADMSDARWKAILAAEEEARREGAL